MKLLEAEHDLVTAHLKNIKEIFAEMREAGLGGEDFEYLYLQQRLIPTVLEIFKPEELVTCLKE